MWQIWYIFFKSVSLTVDKMLQYQHGGASTHEQDFCSFDGRGLYSVHMHRSRCRFLEQLVEIISWKRRWTWIVLCDLLKMRIYIWSNLKSEMNMDCSIRFSILLWLVFRNLFDIWEWENKKNSYLIESVDRCGSLLSSFYLTRWVHGYKH
jgi:hypothetical protein